MRALDALDDLYGSVPDGQRIMEMLTGTDGPIVAVLSGIYAEIPL